MNTRKDSPYQKLHAAHRISLTHGTFIRKIFLLELFAFLLLLPAARAQLYTGSVTGVVTDPSSAVIAGASVTLTDSEKGYESQAKTDTSGRYLFRSVPPGNYRISVEATGFETT